MLQPSAAPAELLVANVRLQFWQWPSFECGRSLVKSVLIYLAPGVGRVSLLMAVRVKVEYEVLTVI